MDLPSRESSASLVVSASSTTSIQRKSLRLSWLGDLEDRALGEVDELARRAPRASGPWTGSRTTRAGGGGASRCRARCGAYWRTLPTAGTEPDSRSIVGAAADGVELAGVLEVVDERERIDLPASAVEVEHRLEDDPVALAVEVIGLQALVDDEGRERGVGEQDGAEDASRPPGSAAASPAASSARPCPLVVGSVGSAHGPIESRCGSGGSTGECPLGPHDRATRRRTLVARCAAPPRSGGWRLVQAEGRVLIVPAHLEAAEPEPPSRRRRRCPCPRRRLRARRTRCDRCLDVVNGEEQVGRRATVAAVHARPGRSGRRS